MKIFIRLSSSSSAAEFETVTDPVEWALDKGLQLRKGHSMYMVFRGKKHMGNIVPHEGRQVFVERACNLSKEQIAQMLKHPALRTLKL